MTNGDTPGQRTWYVGGEDEDALTPDAVSDDAQEAAPTDASDSNEEPREAPVEAADDAPDVETADEDAPSQPNDEPADDVSPEPPTPPADEDDDNLESTLVHRQSLLKMADDIDADKEEQAPEEPTEPTVSAAQIEAELSAKEAEKDAKDLLEWDDKKSEPTDREREEAIFDGATVLPAVPSRVAAHLWSLVLSLILVPVTWYLTWDAASRLTLPKGSQWHSGSLDVYALVELGGAAVALFVLILLARWSSLGAFVTGLVIFACGLPFIIMPGTTAKRLDPIVNTLQGQNDFTSNVAHHMVWSGSTGFFIFAGVALIALGFVSHGARRKGRKDFLAKRKVDRTKRSRGIDA